MALLVCDKVAVGYGDKKIVENLSFTVNSGDYLCIFGKNGSGKSTLIKTLLKLMNPISGKITMGDGLKQNEIGYLPQQTVIQRDFPASVEEIVLSGCLNHCGIRPFYNANEKKSAHDNMKKLNICDLAKKCYRELSGGQQQRVLLARALCATGKLLLLDEPVAGLDPKITHELYQMIEKLNKTDGITIIMISHDISSAVRYANKILHINNTPLFFGSKNDYMKTNLGRSYDSFSGGYGL